MQPVLNRGSPMDDPNRADPPDVFCSLGSLIVEGRVPSKDDRGYAEGPHVPPPRNIPIGRHECTSDNYMCKRDENFRKHLLLLWQNNVPISIEVLLCSDCRSGEKKSAPTVKFSSVPEPGAVLLEQWTVSIHSQSPTEQPITSRGLFQAVRSFLHFSQLSAWYSSTKGLEPKNVLYRITIPGENFSTKFASIPIEHFFPPASVGQSSCVFVSVRSLPRRSEIPKVECYHSPTNTVGLLQSHVVNGSTVGSDTGQRCSPVLNEGEERKLPMAGALSWKESDLNETDLRKTIVKTRLAECSGMDRSDSLDSILGDSLLDPPQCLQKIPPKRYQSPSRCGSPSLEAPDHLLFGNSINHLRKRDEDIGSSGQARRARQDLLRRRDLNLYHGLHPRALDHHQTPLSLPICKAITPEMRLLKPVTSQHVGPYKAFPRDEEPANSESQPTEEDCEFVGCMQTGKRSCMLNGRGLWRQQQLESDISLSDISFTYKSFSDKMDNSTSSAFDFHAKELTLGLNDLTLGAKNKKKRDTKLRNETETDEVGEDGEEVVEYLASDLLPDQPYLYQRDMQELLAAISPKDSTCSSRRSSIKDDESLFGHLTSKRKGKQVDDIFDDGSCHSQQRFQPINSITQVYRAETSTPSQQQQQLLRPQQQHHLQRPTTLLPPPLEKSEILLGAILRTSERNRHLEDEPDLCRADPSSNFESRRHYDDGDRLNRVTTPKGFNFQSIDLTEKLQDKFQVETSIEKIRLRSRSENISSQSDDSATFFDPLESSFDEDKFLEQKLSNWYTWSYGNRHGHYPHSPDDESFQAPEGELHDCNHQQINGNCNNKENCPSLVPSTDQVNTFLKSFDSATCMVFHGRTGLPLTSSPAPLRRGKGKFDYDSAISSPHDIKRALFQSQMPERLKKVDENNERIERRRRHSQKLLSASAPATITSTNLLCNFEESVLNGRLEPVSTVEGFTAEIGASGSFHPKHNLLPVTVFFYTLCDNATVSSPYLGHINLGKKGYRVPQKGTIQVTLFNPLGTVVKMFVVVYDLSDMPPNSQTFLRQRTLYMPSDLCEANNEDAQKWLRYLVHLRFASSKSGKVYLHTDIRMIIFRKSDLDTATDHSQGKGYELRSFTKGPTNPKFSPRR